MFYARVSCIFAIFSLSKIILAVPSASSTKPRLDPIPHAAVLLNGTVTPKNVGVESEYNHRPGGNCQWCPGNRLNVIHYQWCFIVNNTLDQTYYTGACYNKKPLSPDRPKDLRTPDQNWADDAKAFIGYYAKARKPSGGVAKTAINSDKSKDLKSAYSTTDWPHKHGVRRETAAQMIRGINRLITYDEWKPNIADGTNGIAIVTLKNEEDDHKRFNADERGIIFYPSDCHFSMARCERTHRPDWDWIPNNDRGYAPGWCGVHVYNDQGRGVAPYFALWGYINDANGFLVEWARETQMKHEEQTLPISGPLPDVMVIGGADQDHVTYAYADQVWNSSDIQTHHCKEGGYLGEIRQIDCGFTC